jgi:hypothetical protein
MKPAINEFAVVWLGTTCLIADGGNVGKTLALSGILTSTICLLMELAHND